MLAKFHRTIFIILSTMTYSHVAYSDDTQLKVNFTASILPVTYDQIQVQVLNRELAFYSCNLVVEGRLKLANSIAPEDSLLFNPKIFVLPKGVITPKLIFGQNELRENGVPGQYFASAEIQDKDCEKINAVLKREGQNSTYKTGDDVQITFSKAGVDPSYWGDYAFTSSCSWLQVSEYHGNLIVKGKVPPNFTSCEGTVTSMASVLEVKSNFNIVKPTPTPSPNTDTCFLHTRFGLNCEDPSPIVERNLKARIS